MRYIAFSEPEERQKAAESVMEFRETAGGKQRQRKGIEEKMSTFNDLSRYLTPFCCPDPFFGLLIAYRP